MNFRLFLENLDKLFQIISLWNLLFSIKSSYNWGAFDIISLVVITIRNWIITLVVMLLNFIRLGEHWLQMVPVSSQSSAPVSSWSYSQALMQAANSSALNDLFPSTSQLLKIAHPSFLYGNLHAFLSDLVGRCPHCT